MKLPLVTSYSNLQLRLGYLKILAAIGTRSPTTNEAFIRKLAPLFPAPPAKASALKAEFQKPAHSYIEKMFYGLGHSRGLLNQQNLNEIITISKAFHFLHPKNCSLFEIAVVLRSIMTPDKVKQVQEMDLESGYNPMILDQGNKSRMEHAFFLIHLLTTDLPVALAACVASGHAEPFRLYEGFPPRGANLEEGINAVRISSSTMDVRAPANLFGDRDAFGTIRRGIVKKVKDDSLVPCSERNILLDSYVTMENTPVHKFDILYAETVKNFQIPESIPMVPWLSNGDRRGAIAILSAFFSKWYLEVHGSLDKEGLRDMRVLREMKERTDKILAKIGLHELMAKALQGFVASALALKHDQVQTIAAWAEGQPIINRELGLSRRINANLARDFLRSLALLANNSGIRGSLTLLDEAERVMDQSTSVRKKSYGVIRDLLDNADNQGGMPSSMIYIAATPEMFSSEKGFAEYDALRSRLANTQRFSIPSLMDWRAVVVDLVKTPLPHNHMIQLAEKVRDVHATARQWDPSPHFSDDVIQSLITKIETGNATHVSRPRMLSSLAATLLEVAEQNRGCPLQDAIDATFNDVVQVLTARPEADKWDDV